MFVVCRCLMFVACMSTRVIYCNSAAVMAYAVAASNRQFKAKV